MKTFALLISPLAPHIGEELWQAVGGSKTLAYEPWPDFDETMTKDDTIEIPVQVKGKVRSKVRVPAEASKQDILAAAEKDPKIADILGGAVVLKTIVVPGRLVNFVTKPQVTHCLLRINGTILTRWPRRRPLR